MKLVELLNRRIIEYGGVCGVVESSNGGKPISPGQHDNHMCLFLLFRENDMCSLESSLLPIISISSCNNRLATIHYWYGQCRLLMKTRILMNNPGHEFMKHINARRVGLKMAVGAHLPIQII